jgi:hypothetical protein
MNAVTNNAVVSINNDRQIATVNKAKLFISNILVLQAQIKGHLARIAEYQGEVAKLADDVLTYEAVTGQPAPAAPNANQVSILEAIKKHNEDQQKAITSTAKSYLDGVVRDQASIKAFRKSIDDNRAEIAKLAVDVVVEAEVVGPVTE